MTTTRRTFVAMLGAGAATLALPPAPAEAAQPFRVVKRFTIPRGLVGKTRKVSLAPRPAGGFAALFEFDRGETKRPSYSRFYDARMSPIGTNVPLASTTYSGDSAGTMVVRKDGSGLAFFYGWNGSELDLWWVQRLAANGRAVGKPIRLGTGLDGDLLFAVPLADGRFMAAWRGSSSADNVGKVLLADGRVVAVNEGALCDGSLHGLAELPNGGAVAAYYGPDLKASFQRLDRSAKRVGRPIAVPSLYSFGGMTVAPHPLGFVGVWKNANAAGDPIVEGGVFSSAGARLCTFAPQRLRPSGSEDRYLNFRAVALALSDNGTLVAYASVRRPDPNGAKRYYEIVVARFAADGRLVGRQTLLSIQAETELWAYLHRPRSLIRLSDGRFLLGYDGGYEFGIQEARAILFAPN
ncbi:hypothetical protein [Oharaeibacter diazotrophicus]|uniref:Secreted protein n=1 Tax=Oharaeibacter diazotrophicus TaxID=1920512 RepID=A0A4R6RLR0_9HYPH|nr:hypothetical protein [Oharaeibacter diazotrophicus]TDP86907.1 hypothetical protein EDD54_0791 [Oharaeibacter diazotrophicus]BBE71150.1 hypothetical protein OHA_1_00720 [Pleomorphomonas sp. SM30]GLS77904.1 hypothetical protein GCM10007904_32410 [Oharaeibacter diazotrophicus]